MRRGVWVAVSMAAVLVLAGCAAKPATEPLTSPSAAAVVGTAGETSQSAPASETTQASAPNPAAAEGIPSSLGVQVTSAEGKTTVGQAQAIKIAQKGKSTGSTSPAAQHVLFAKSGDSKPVDAWMVTFHNVPLPGAGGSGSSKETGSITLFIDSSTGAVLADIAYQPVGK